MTTEIDHLTLDDIRARLNASDARQLPVTADVPWAQDAPSSFREAAVLAPLLRVDEAWHLLFIRRAEHDKDYHSGQVAFAGGKREPDDVDLIATATREAQEEIGLQVSDVTVLGTLSTHHSISRFRITPVVAQMPWPYPLQLDSSEVARAFSIPLSWLAQAQNHRIQDYTRPGIGTLPVVEFREYEGERLWGATARMTLSLLACLQASTAL